MKPPRKIHQSAGPVPALRQLKLICLKRRLDGEWVFGLRASHSCSAARAAIASKLGVRLSDDSKFSKFCAWWHRQKEWDALSELSEMDEAALKKRFPHLSRQNLRTAAILRCYAAADLACDPAFRLAVVRVDSAEESSRAQVSIEQKKFEQRQRILMQSREKWLAAQRSELEVALDALYLEVKENPEAVALFRKFKDVVCGTVPASLPRV